MNTDEKSALYSKVDRLAADIEQQVIAWRRNIHENPELSNREANTAQLITEHLESLDLDEVRTGIAGYGVVGVLKGTAKNSGGRKGVVALRADIDALPVKEKSGESFASKVVDNDYPGGPFPVAHACGHDCHAAMLMGAASVLAEIREELPGTVLFVFQPAEEGPPVNEKGGAREMIENDAVNNPEPSMVFGMHVSPTPSGSIAYRSGVQYAASSLVKIEVDGKQVHGSTPWMGIDPWPPAGEIIAGLAQVYRQVPATDPITISIGHVEDEGRFNIVPGKVTLWGTLRCLSDTTMGKMQKAIERTAGNIAKAHGAKARTSFLQEVPPVDNRPEWVDAALPTFRRVAGADNLIEVPPTLGYDDVSEFVHKFGGLYVMLGVQDSEVENDDIVPTPNGRGIVANHNPGFYANEDALVTGVRLHTHVTIDHLAGELAP